MTGSLVAQLLVGIRSSAPSERARAAEEPPRPADPHLSPSLPPLRAEGVGPTPSHPPSTARPRLDVPALHLDGMDPPTRRGPHIPVDTLRDPRTCAPEGHPIDEGERLPRTTTPPAVELTPRGPVVGGEVVVRPMPSMSTSDAYDGTPEGRVTREREDAALLERMGGADPRPSGLPTVDEMVDGVTGRRHIDTTSPEARALDESIRRAAAEERARSDEPD